MVWRNLSRAGSSSGTVCSFWTNISTAGQISVGRGTRIVGKWKFKAQSAEWTESLAISFYGITNVFLDHLSNSGAEWSTTGLEHVSMNALFFSGGLADMLFESSRIRKTLNNTILR